MTQSQKSKIPLNIQFDAAFAASSVHRWREAKEILQPYGYSADVDPLAQAKVIGQYFSFTSGQLLEHLRKNPELCQWMYTDAGDKRYSPATFITTENGKFLVGIYDKDRQDTQAFDTLAEAVTDYILLSSGMPRLNV